MTHLQLAQHLLYHWDRPRVRPALQRPVEMTATESHRRGPAGSDRALYQCGCGYSFTAEVTTTVGCPHCGTSQAW